MNSIATSVLLGIVVVVAASITALMGNNVYKGLTESIKASQKEGKEEEAEETRRERRKYLIIFIILGVAIMILSVEAIYTT